MKHSLKTSIFWVANKIRVDARATFNDVNPAVRDTMMNDNHSVIYNLMASLSLTIIHPRTEGEERSPWNPNDSLLCTKYNIPIFVRELRNIYEGMKTPNLYTYTDGRLELNEEIGENIRKVFMIGQTTVELSPVIVAMEKPDGEEHLEGIKMKFNNENSSVTLTLNEAYSMLCNIEKADVDMLALQMYQLFITTGSKVSNSASILPEVDIRPLHKQEEF